MLSCSRGRKASSVSYSILEQIDPARPLKKPCETNEQVHVDASMGTVEQCPCGEFSRRYPGKRHGKIKEATKFLRSFWLFYMSAVKLFFRILKRGISALAGPYARILEACTRSAAKKILSCTLVAKPHKSIATQVLVQTKPFKAVLASSLTRLGHRKRTSRVNGEALSPTMALRPMEFIDTWLLSPLPSDTN